MIKVDKLKVTWNDLQAAGAKELKDTYKITDRQLDAQIRSHMDGSNAAERRKIYNEVYRRR